METKQEEVQNFNEYQAIVNALTPYIESAGTGNGEVIRTPFYDHAHVVGSMDGKYMNLTVNEFGNVIDTLGESTEVKHRIAWIDISGPAAAVKVEFINWLGFRFTDFLILYKNDGVWKISGKTFDSHSRN